MSQPNVAIAVIQQRTATCVVEQRRLVVRLSRAIGAHQELVTIDGEPVTFEGEEVWVMVPDA